MSKPTLVTYELGYTMFRFRFTTTPSTWRWHDTAFPNFYVDLAEDALVVRRYYGSLEVRSEHLPKDPYQYVRVDLLRDRLVDLVRRELNGRVEYTPIQACLLEPPLEEQEALARYQLGQLPQEDPDEPVLTDPLCDMDLLPGVWAIRGATEEIPWDGSIDVFGTDDENLNFSFRFMSTIGSIDDWLSNPDKAHYRDVVARSLVRKLQERLMTDSAKREWLSTASYMISFRGHQPRVFGNDELTSSVRSFVSSIIR